MRTLPSAFFARRYQLVFSSRTVGVMNENVYERSSALPASDLAVSSIVTSYLVANGKGVFSSGVKISVVVSDQRKAPLMAGATWNQGTTSALGTLPTTIIGSEKTTRISLASAS